MTVLVAPLPMLLAAACSNQVTVTACQEFAALFAEIDETKKHIQVPFKLNSEFYWFLGVEIDYCTYNQRPPQRDPHKTLANSKADSAESADVLGPTGTLALQNKGISKFI